MLGNRFNKYNKHNIEIKHYLLWGGGQECYGEGKNEIAKSCYKLAPPARLLRGQEYYATTGRVLRCVF